MYGPSSWIEAADDENDDGDDENDGGNDENEDGDDEKGKSEG